MGIETVGLYPKKGGEHSYYETPTVKQIKTLKILTQYLAKQFSLSKDRISYHGIVSTNKKPNEGKLIYKAIIENADIGVGGGSGGSGGSGDGSGSGGGSGNGNDGGGSGGDNGGGDDGRGDSKLHKLSTP